MTAPGLEPQPYVGSEAQATHTFVGSDLTLVNPGFGDAETLSRVFRVAAAT